MKRGKQHGAALVVAIFLIVVLALLGAVAVRLTGVQQQTVNLSLLSERALLASRSGIEWAAYRALSSGTCAAASTTLTEVGVNGFTVDIDCSSSTHNEGTAVTTVYQLDAFAHAGNYGSPDYVSRRQSAVVSQTL
ncbi:MAG: pilus assembly protein MshP [Gammaproteobacteria bacterium]|nr:pilus assembly protein MshP [Gammaproteobacteria bacterium]MDH3768825.1 pilus assembly protein MshP [Gammaproteobacteria bacterium]